MTVKKQGTDELLGIDKFNVDEDNAHIVLKKELCESCISKPCLVICPAKLYKLSDNGQVQFDYAGCFECGTCRIICPEKGNGAVSWSLPQGTFGVSFRFG